MDSGLVTVTYNIIIDGEIDRHTEIPNDTIQPSYAMLTMTGRLKTNSLVCLLLLTKS